MSFPGGLVVKNLPARGRCKRCWFHLWVKEMPWRRAWQPTWVLLTGESHGQRSLVGYSPWGRKELGTTEATWHTSMHYIYSQRKKIFGSEWRWWVKFWRFPDESLLQGVASLCPHLVLTEAHGTSVSTATHLSQRTDSLPGKEQPFPGADLPFTAFLKTLSSSRNNL